MTDVLMPALSPTMEEGTLAKWHVKVGDAVKSGDVIAEIETDKATMEVEAVDEGVIEALLVPEGTEAVKVNAPIARLRGEGRRWARAAIRAPAGPSLSAVTRGETSPRQGGSHAFPASRHNDLGGPFRHDPRTGERRRQACHRLAPGPPPGGAGRRRSGQRQGLRSPRPDHPPRRRGPGRGTAATAGTPVPATARAAAEPPRQALSLEQMGIAPGSYDLVPLDGMKRTVARRMTDSFRDVPHFPLTIDLEIDALLSGRSAINALLAAEGLRVSVNDLVIKAAAVALRRVPAANASYTPDGIAMHRHADIAVAVAVDGGLITPIVRLAQAKGVAEIAREMKDLAERARGRKLKPQEFQGGTFSVSNLGMFGIKSFASIINEPQGAILSVGAGEKRAVVRGDAVEVATVMSVTLTCDHRVVDGAIGARWLQVFRALIQDPLTMIV